MKCPKCKLINPETAQICDCGYDFIQRRLGEPPDWSDAPAAGKKRRSNYRSGMLLAAGLGCIALGLLCPVGIIVMALSGGSAWLNWLLPASPCLVFLGVVFCYSAVRQ